MSQGLQVWDGGGAIVLDTNTRAGVALGVISTGTSAGSFIDADLSLGEPFFFTLPGAPGWNGNVAVITISGTTIYWSFPSAGSNQSSLIIYGIK